MATNSDPEKVPYHGEHSSASGDRTHLEAVKEDRLRRSLSARQVQMIAIGGTIGTGLFLGMSRGNPVSAGRQCQQEG